MKIVLVVHTVDRSFVLQDCDADTEWTPEWAKAKLEEGNLPFKRRRGDALLLAHNIQNRVRTHWGVHEIFLEKRPKRTFATTPKDRSRGRATNERDRKPEDMEGVEEE